MSLHDGVILDATITPDDVSENRYPAIPFEVVPGTTSFEVRLDYDPSAAVIDLGCSGPDGWRGWSGGARRRFTIGEHESTWGYLAGPLTPGTWEVVLGLHAIPADGVRAVVRVSSPGTPIGPEPPAPSPQTERPPARSLPAVAGRRWFAGELHAHTLHSDGASTPSQLVGMAARSGLDFLAVTDHNTTSHHASLAAIGARYGVLAMPGQEVTTHRGHANAIGDVGWVDFRRHPDDWFAQVDAAGGVLSVNHPIAGDCSWQWPLREAPHAVEIGHSAWARDLRSQAPWAWLQATGWESALVAGGDFHGRGGAAPGTWVTWVAAAELSTDGIVEGIRSGATAFSRGVDGPVVLRVGDELVVDGGAGLVLVDPDGRTHVLRSETARLPGTPGPHRLETPDRAVVAACT